MIDFVHLHVHTDFSLLDGAATAAQLTAKAREMGQRYLAITDHGNMFGVLKFRDACLLDKEHKLLPPEEQIQPIIGCEFYMAPASRHDKTGLRHTANTNDDDTSEYSDGKPFHLVLLATCEKGYHNLSILSSLAYIEGFYYKPRIDEELLVKYHDGLICLSACLAGEIPRLILKDKKDEAEKRALWFRDLFGEDEQGNANFFLEIQDHGIKAQHDSNPVIIELAKKTGIGLVVTNDVHYLNKEDNIAHDILLCVGTQKKRSDENRMRFPTDQFYFKSGDEMAALFPACPEAITNTVKIAQRCKCEIPIVPKKELSNYLPEFPIPNNYENMNEYLRAITMKGLSERYTPLTDEIKQRAEYELDIIIKMGFTGYFLIVADFMNWAKDHGIPIGPGRGSGAGSIVAYATHITNIEPIKYGLLFERFLNPERISMPDFDCDFCEARRHEVVEYVINKYGQDRVAQIVTMGTLKAKNAIKDVARVLGITTGESNMIAKLVPDGPKVTLKQAFVNEPKLAELEKDPRYTELFAIARKLEGKNRQVGLHAAGVVISKTNVIDYVPLYRDNKKGLIATQYTMDQIEDCGLVKMDFLGISNLTMIRNAEEVIRKRGGEFAAFDIEKIPEDDKATFEIFCSGKTAGAFQFESDGMQNVLKKARPDKIEDLIALNALYRPGPMGYIDKFIEGKFEASKIVYPDPCLKEILQETYGVIVYQEQVMQVAQKIAGYSLGQADLLRRAMSKKKKDEIAKEKLPFIDGAVKNGFTPEKAAEIYDILVPFADYGFNKSHAAAYAVVAYQTMYLKANFPVEFMAAKLTNVINTTDQLSLYIDEVRKMGIVIDPPDVNHSEQTFSVHDGKIFYGLIGIKGVGENSACEIIRARAEGHFKDFMDFLDRVDIKIVGKRVVEILIQTGAFDQFGMGRSMLNANLENAVLYSQKKKDEKNSAQASLFEDSGEKEYEDFKFITVPDWTRDEKLLKEKELIGFYFSGHPLDDYKSVWEKHNQIDLGKSEMAIAGRDYRLVGIIKSVRTLVIKNGANAGGRMGSAVLADYNGEIDLTFFTDQWEKYGGTIAVDKIIAIRGKYDRRNDKPGVIVWEVYDPSELDDIIDESRTGNYENTNTNKAEQNKKSSFVNSQMPSLALLDPYKDFYQRAVKIDLSNLSAAKHGEEYIFIGILASLKPHTIEKGKHRGSTMGFGSLCDYKGQIDIIFFTNEWERYGEKLTVDSVVAFKGIYEQRENKQSVLYQSPIDLSKLDTLAWREIHIRLQNEAIKSEDDLLPLRDCLCEHTGPCKIYIHIPTRDSETIIKTTTQLSGDASIQHIDALKQCPIVSDAWRN